MESIHLSGHTFHLLELDSQTNTPLECNHGDLSF